MKEHAQKIGEWQRAITPPESNTPKHHFNRSLEEMRELHDAIQADDGTPLAREEINFEATDVIIRMVGLIEANGGDVNKLLTAKISLATEKYKPSEVQGELKKGFPFNEAMARRKTIYEAKNPPQIRLF